jgi:hypothetical protein
MTPRRTIRNTRALLDPARLAVLERIGARIALFRAEQQDARLTGDWARVNELEGTLTILRTAWTAEARDAAPEGLRR